MSDERGKVGLIPKVGAVVLLVAAMPAVFLDMAWQGWLVLFGVAILAFVVTAIMTRGRRI
jgi:hypothetical protein